ncbi:MAG: stage II sporulation protein D [Oscillospiraceae bacterium]
MCLFLALIMVITPLVSLSSNLSWDGKFSQITDKLHDSDGQADNNKKSAKTGTFKILIAGTNDVVELSELEYICGAVACEMPVTYHVEALKAQAVACYTYAVNARNNQLKSADPALKGAYLSSDCSIHQGYKTKEQLKNQWGDKYETYYSKIESAVKSVLGEVITYNGELITAAYHAISSGKTESASVVWGGEVPYLVSANSAGDRLSPDYSSTLVLNTDQFSQIASGLEGVSLSPDASTWVSSPVVSDAGVVKSITIGGKSFDGNTVRKAFSLRSSCFTVEFKNNTFIFNVIGYGHCVGLSQYGSDYMSRQGSNYKEILTHYYSGVKVVDLA